MKCGERNRTVFDSLQPKLTRESSTPSGVRTVGSCATGCREPCQAGNRAALSGFILCAAANSAVRTPEGVLLFNTA